MSDLTIVELKGILDQVEEQNLVPDPRRLQSNPALNAAKVVFDSLREAIDDICLRGEAAIEAAKQKVVVVWQRESAKLKERAAEALSIFQKMTSDLIKGMMEAISSFAPQSLNGEASILDQISFKITLAVSPSVGVAVQEVLRLAASSGVEVQFAYKPAITKES